ncbi:nucleotidyltransferase family protein [Pseudomonas mucidolens]|uniref:Molybdenum cofactor cytidylyltransferase n=1 Tax=Pseudomonas mucidolens TaxID=46679 RepID=A0A1H2N8J9_9PSED|nr:nucleotidyltransferase family protein [Pseudomonas mucidolens]SDV01385.1 molybdenum cofactor cytidylyltransferase [Pseudomonas mucidolens]SQH32489.1 family 2 glycosyl transferase [Pseudomonas mucidolens]
MTDSIAVIVLAAGQGSRFRAVAGQDKLLASCVGLDGVTRPVIEQVLVNLPCSVKKRCLVTRPERTEVIRLAQHYGCEVVLLDSSGMGDSLAAAVTASGSSDGWLVLLGDMPFVLPSSVERVIEGLQAHGICVPVQGGSHGHPVGFGRAFGPGLMALSGDRGAKALFAGATVREVQVGDPGVLWDVDVPQRLDFKPIGPA